MILRVLQAIERSIGAVSIAVVIAGGFCLLRFWVERYHDENRTFEYVLLAERRLMDVRLLQRGPITPGPEVAIVAVDDASISELGRWPWPRSVLAHLIDRIAVADPRAIALDMVFSEPSSFSERPGGVTARPSGVSEESWQATQHALEAQDIELREALRRSKRAVLGYFFDLDNRDHESTGEPPSTFSLVKGTADGRGEAHIPRGSGIITNLPGYELAAQASGYFNQIPDEDGFVRRLPMVIRFGEDDDMAMPLELAALKVAFPETQLTLRFAPFGAEGVYWGNRRLPVAEDGKLLINYRGVAKTFPHISAARLLDGTVSDDELRDKIVFVGVTAVAVADYRVTPFDQLFPGVEIHANAVDNILRGDFITQPDWLVLVDIATIALLGLILGLAMRRLRGVGAAVLALALLVTYLYVSQRVFVDYGYPLGLIYQILTVGLTYSAVAVEQYVTEEREKRKMRRALDLYLSPSMAKLVSDHPERLKLGGEKRELTVMFSDIRGFTKISEGLDPEVLVELLNEYLGAMTEIVFAHKGMLDKYIGDAVMAIWGAPLPQAQHAAHACHAALAMVERLAALNRVWTARRWEPLRIGIGLNTGPMAFGNMGSAQHLSLTVMGDNVNLGSRIEGLTKAYGANILASESTIRGAGPIVVTRELDLVRVRGKQEPVRIYEILGPASQAAKWEGLIETFDIALKKYRDAHWDAAIRSFTAVEEYWPNDKATKLFLDRCRRLAQDPPSDWDGVFNAS